MCADNPRTAAVNLALRALADAGVHILCYHINTPDPDPLANAATVELADHLKIDQTPVVLINGRVVPLTEQDLLTPDSVLTALGKADGGITPQRVDVEVRAIADGRREVTVLWSEGLDSEIDRVDLYCVESAVLLNSANHCWLHGQVTRGQMARQDLHRTPGRATAVLDPQVLRDSYEAYAHQVESELQITYRTIPTYIDIRRCSVVVKLSNRVGDLVAVGVEPL